MNRIAVTIMHSSKKPITRYGSNFPSSSPIGRTGVTKSASSVPRSHSRAITIDVKDKIGLALEVNESVGDSPLLVGVTLSLAAPLDDLGAGLELVAGNIKDQTSATVNDEAALEAPELKFQKGVAGR